MLYSKYKNEKWKTTEWWIERVIELNTYSECLSLVDIFFVYFLLQNHIFVRSLQFNSSECWTLLATAIAADAWFDVIVVRSLDVCVTHTLYTFSSSCSFNFVCSLAPFMSKQNILIKCANGMCGHGKTNERTSEMNDDEDENESLAQFTIIHILIRTYKFTERRNDQYSKTLLPFLFSLFWNFSFSNFYRRPHAIADFDPKCVCED